jgi:hypothetical protein
MVLQLVVFPSADNICGRLPRTGGKRDVSADTQGPVEYASESKLKFACQVLGGDEQN